MFQTDYQKIGVYQSPEDPYWIKSTTKDQGIPCVFPRFYDRDDPSVQEKLTG